MKLPLILALLPLVGCAYRDGATYAGGQMESRWRHATLGTDIEGEEVSASQMKLAKQNQSAVAIPAIRTAGTLGTAVVAANLAEAISADSTAVSLGSQGVERSRDAGQAATNQLRIKEATKVKTFVPPPQ